MKPSRILVLALVAGLALAAGCSSDKTTQAPLPQDEAPPLPPAGLAAAFQPDGTAKLTWSPNTEPDLAGYRVYQYDPDPGRPAAYRAQNGGELVADSEFTLVVPLAGSIWVTVTAVDQSENESPAAAPFQIVWQQLPNTQDDGPTKPPLDGDQAPIEEPRGGGTTSPPGGDGSGPDGGHDPTSPPGEDPNQH